MAHLRRILVGAIGALTLAGAGAVGAGASDTLVAFDSMTGVAPAGVNVVNDRGIAAGGAPWVVNSATGTVDHQGNVSVQVTGLIIPILSPPHNRRFQRDSELHHARWCDERDDRTVRGKPRR